MRILYSEQRLCISCMKEHNIDIIETEENVTFKDIKIKFNATYEYCANTDEYLETEDMIRANNLVLKDAYRREVGLLTSNEIINIREKYGISQKEFSEILNWGKATITRYENHQVQDRAHDDILRKIGSDPKWFLELLERSRKNISPKAYSEYYFNAHEQCTKQNNPYLYKSINTCVSFSNWKSVGDNIQVEESINQSYKIEDHVRASYIIMPLWINNKCILAF